MDLLTKSLLLLLTAAKIRFFGDMVYRQILIFAVMEVSTGDAGVSPAVICPGTQAPSPAESIYKFTIALRPHFLWFSAAKLILFFELHKRERRK